MGNKNSRGSQQGKKFDPSQIQPNPERGALLSKVPLLAKFSQDERDLMGGAGVEQKFSDGTPIIKQGDIGHGFYILLEGEAVVTRIDDKNEETIIGSLKSGDYFGEAALINESRRGATVKAHGTVKCLFFDRSAFAGLFASTKKVKVLFAKRTAISAEAGGAVQRPSVVAPVNAVKEKSKQTKSLIKKAVKGNLLFEGLSKEHTNTIIDQMWLTEIKEGVSVIRQGERGDNLYVVESGSFDIFVQSGSSNRKVATRGAGTCFGELALMYNAPRAATVTATESSKCWVVDRFTFRKVLANVSDAEIHESLNFLKGVELLAPLSAREREKIAEALESITAPSGTVLCKQGDVGDCMYILKSGEVVCTIDGKEMTRYAPGSYFGERALLKEEPRAATLECSKTCELLQLDRAAFSLLLGPLEDIMSGRLHVYKQMSEQKLGTGQDEDDKDAAKDDKILREDLEVLGTLGKGSFGHVQLVKHKGTGKTFALKAVSKQQICVTGQQGHIMSEKRVMAQLNHPFLIRLYNTYQDRDRLYFLLEPSLGGELFSVLRARTFFDEDTARFYAAQVILAFEYMHKRNIIYRDLKPENLLLDDKGYLKVTDFGFAKVVSGRTYTLCGTPDYLAPEIVAGRGHGKGVDWWTLGILIYEMLSSYPPFYDDDPLKTYARIMNGRITYPSHFSKDAVSIISKLLHPKATKRLGVTKGGATSIKNHKWFSKFDWDALINKKIKAPIIPKIADATDLSNFDDYPDDDDVPPYVDDQSGWADDF